MRGTTFPLPKAIGHHAGFHFRQIEYGVDHADQPFGLGKQNGEQPLLLLRNLAHYLLEKEICAFVYGGERRSQLMRDHGQEIALHPVDRRQFLAHGIEGLRELRDLRWRLDVEITLEYPGRDFSGLLDQFPQRIRDAPGHKNGYQKGTKEGDQGRYRGPSSTRTVPHRPPCSS